jgi:hypothetical protein
MFIAAGNRSRTEDEDQREAGEFMAQADALAAERKYAEATRAYTSASGRYRAALETWTFDYRDELTDELNNLLASGSILDSDVDRRINVRILETDKMVARGDFEAAVEEYNSIFSPYIDLAGSWGRTVR